MIDFAGERALILPKALLAGAAAVALLAVGGAAASRVAGLPTVGARVEVSPPAAVRDLRFSDLPDGGVAVHDAASGVLVATLAPGTNGFVRGTLRGLARERHRRGLGSESPLRLLARMDGSLAVEDPATGISIDVGSFGSDNDRAYRRLLSAP